MALKSGTCSTCSKEDVKLRPNPFTKADECEDCRTDGSKAIVGITAVKTDYGLKEGDLEGLQTIKEPKPAFVGGPDYRWYLKSEVESRAKEVEKTRAIEAKEKEQQAKAKAAEKAKKLAEKDAAKKAKVEAKAKKAEVKEKEKEEKAAERKRKRDERDVGKPPKAKREKGVATRKAPSRAAANKKSVIQDDDDDE